MVELAIILMIIPPSFWPFIYALYNKIVVATHSGNQLTQKDNADSGVQFITTVGPRQSLLLAKDPNQFLWNHYIL